MLTSLSIKNFQSHKNTHLEFHSGVNTIIGPSDCGKSAILRALNLVLTNKPSGTTYCSNFTKDPTEVTISVDNHEIVRKRNTGTVNQYLIDSEVYKAFNQNAPDEIFEITKIGDINISSQLEAPFLLSLSSGEVARYLNKIVGLDKIDSSLSNIASVITEIKKTWKFQEAELQQIEKDLLAYSDLEVREIALQNLEELGVQQQTATAQIEQLTKQIPTIQKQEATLQEIENWLLVEAPAQSISNKIQILQDISRHVRDLISVQEKIAGLTSTERELDDILSLETELQQLFIRLEQQTALKQAVNTLSIFCKTIPDLEAQLHDVSDFAELDYSEIQKSVDSRMSKISDIRQLIRLTNNIRTQEEDFESCSMALERLQTRLSELQPDICPLCGGTQ